MAIKRDRAEPGLGAQAALAGTALLGKGSYSHPRSHGGKNPFYKVFIAVLALPQLVLALPLLACSPVAEEGWGRDFLDTLVGPGGQRVTGVLFPHRPQWPVMTCQGLNAMGQGIGSTQALPDFRLRGLCDHTC